MQYYQHIRHAEGVLNHAERALREDGDDQQPVPPPNERGTTRDPQRPAESDKHAKEHEQEVRVKMREIGDGQLQAGGVLVTRMWSRGGDQRSGDYQTTEHHSHGGEQAAQWTRYQRPRWFVALANG